MMQRMRSFNFILDNADLCLQIITKYTIQSTSTDRQKKIELNE